MVKNKQTILSKAQESKKLEYEQQQHALPSKGMILYVNKEKTTRQHHVFVVS